MGDILCISTPMWNFTVPYRVKQYVDMALQPDKNFKVIQTGNDFEPEVYEPMGPNNRSLVTISSSGDKIGPFGDAYLTPYLRDVFKCLGFTEHESLIMRGAAEPDRREKLLKDATTRARDIAYQLNDKFS